LGERQKTDPPLFFETHVFICTNRRPDGHERGSCAQKGAEKLKDYMKARVKEEKIQHIRINAAACLDRCELGPCAVIYPEGVWYKIDSRAAVDEVIAKHIEQHGRVPGLMIDRPD